MSRTPEYERGYRDGVKFAAHWLQKRAEGMNDPHARQILNGASTNLGWSEARRAKKARRAKQFAKLYSKEPSE